MATIALTKGAVALVDDTDVVLMSENKWHLTSNGYAARRVHGRTVLMHRVICGALAGQEVDHIDGNGLNNQRSNLRLATHTENMWNRKRHADNRSGYKGLSPSGSKWKVEIRVNKRTVYLGSFADPVMAARAYDAAAAHYHGEFARTNL